MVIIEFINSPDKEILCPYERHQPLITIGRSLKHDIIVADPEIGDNYLTIFTDPQGIWVENNNKEKFYFSNDKKTSGKKLHKVGDKIQIGETSFTILDFKHEHELDSIGEFKKLQQKKLEEDPNLGPQLETIKSAIKHITFKIIGHEEEEH